MKSNHLINWVKIILVVSGLSLIGVLFVPMWQIQLNAPQYPEGLVLKIYPHKLGGSVDIINGLNHYIGMKTLHTKDFIEFTILPYIIVFFALLCFIVLFLNRKKWLILLTVLFVVFGIVAMYDFWRWEYNYGHDLNPEAAIQIPGMAYQPPLIGYKQLLNFAAYSIPDIGGFLFLGVGVLLVVALVIQILNSSRNKKTEINSKKAIIIVTSWLLIFFSSCNTAPPPIKIGTDACSFCKMTITDNRFGGEIITKKGKAYKFDDIHCLLVYSKPGLLKSEAIDKIYLVNFNSPHNFVEASKAHLLKSEELHTPMAGNIAAFESGPSLNAAEQRFKGALISWKDLASRP